MSPYTTSTLATFPYQKLDTATTIRLIQVLSDPGDDKIVCEIRAVDMETSPDLIYYALSYVWGDAKATREIFLKDMGRNQKYLQPLHENLWQFLDQIRNQRISGFSVLPRRTLIWTDALCLNQKDEQEKAQQVPRMGTIYSRATIVLAWLGPDRELKNELKRLRKSDENIGFYEALDIPFADATHPQSPCKLAKHPYWRRTWILQEIVLARRPYIMAGDVIMDFYKLQTQLLRSKIPKKPGWNWLETILHLQTAEGARRRRPLWRIVKYLLLYEKSRTADAIYGILGLGRKPLGWNIAEGSYSCGLRQMCA